MQHPSYAPDRAPVTTPVGPPQQGRSDRLSRSATLQEHRGHAGELAARDLRVQMLAFIRGAQSDEHPSQLAARLDAIIRLTREVCRCLPILRRRGRRRETGQGSDLPQAALNPAITRVLRNLDVVRDVLEGRESSPPGLRHVLDPLLVAYLRGEFGRT